jgi:hypothetical protein
MTNSLTDTQERCWSLRERESSWGELPGRLIATVLGIGLLVGANTIAAAQEPRRVASVVCTIAGVAESMFDGEDWRGGERVTSEEREEAGVFSVSEIPSETTPQGFIFSRLDSLIPRVRPLGPELKESDRRAHILSRFRENIIIQWRGDVEVDSFTAAINLRLERATITRVASDARTVSVIVYVADCNGTLFAPLE